MDRRGCVSSWRSTASRLSRWQKKNSGYIAIGRYPDDTLNYARRACQRGLERVNEWLGYGGT